MNKDMRISITLDENGEPFVQYLFPGDEGYEDADKSEEELADLELQDDRDMLRSQQSEDGY